MSNWRILESIIKGDLRPHKVTTKEDLKRITALTASKEPDGELAELIDIEYPAPITDKSTLYYWLIKYQTRAIKDYLENLVLGSSDKEHLLYSVKSQLVYGLKLKEEAEIYRLQLNEAPEAIMVDENCYIAGCCVRYLDLLLNDLIDFYQYLLPEEVLSYFYLRLNERKIKTIAEVEKRFEAIMANKKKNTTPLFTFNAPTEKQDELTVRLYSFLENSNRIGAELSTFKRHFVANTAAFERILWKGAVPEIKVMFRHLVDKNILIEPDENLDHLIHLHFLSKNKKIIGENYISQSTSRLSGSPRADKLKKDLDNTFSNFISNKSNF